MSTSYYSLDVNEYDPNMVRQCGAPVISKEEFWARQEQYHIQAKKSKPTNKTDSTVNTPKQVSIRYVQFIVNESDRLSQAQFIANHQEINQVFSGINSEFTSKVPNNSLYPTNATFANPNIQFLPLQASQLTVETYRIEKPLVNNNVMTPLKDAKRRIPPKTGVLNFYTGPVSSANGSLPLLGISDIGGMNVFVLNASVGGEGAPSALKGQYDYGSRTSCHEIGHAMSLVHTWCETTGCTCTGRPVYSDLSEDLQPNYSAELVRDAVTGEWTGQKDNRWYYRNGQANPNVDNAQQGAYDVNDLYSCAKYYDSQSSTIPIRGETAFLSIMDYARDSHSIGFSQEQVTMMNEFLDTWLVVNGLSVGAWIGIGFGIAIFLLIVIVVAMRVARHKDLSTTRLDQIDVKNNPGIRYVREVATNK